MLFSLVLFKTLVMTVSCSSSVDLVTKISSIIPMTFLILENIVSRINYRGIREMRIHHWKE